MMDAQPSELVQQGKDSLHHVAIDPQPAAVLGVGLGRRPEIFNADQVSQFAGEAFTGVLVEAGIVISMGGVGQA